ncbi:MAG: aminoacyl-tRNA hydrolase [Clostridia bacterium]
MHLIVGLGNPGAQYAHTRHNVGFDVLEALSAKLGIPIVRKRDNALVGEGTINGQRVALALPQTFMNLSGQAVSRLMHWYKVEPQNLLVIYDDIDLPQSTVRVRKNGSAGTHNGMRSIVQELGYDSFPRIRVGVGDRKPGYDLADWVLSRYLPEEREAVQEAYAQAADAAIEYVSVGVESAMCKYNTKKPKKPPQPPKEGETE